MVCCAILHPRKSTHLLRRLWWAARLWRGRGRFTLWRQRLLLTHHLLLGLLLEARGNILVKLPWELWLTCALTLPAAVFLVALTGCTAALFWVRTCITLLVTTEVHKNLWSIVMINAPVVSGIFENMYCTFLVLHHIMNSNLLPVILLILDFVEKILLWMVYSAILLQMVCQHSCP